jgi:hypothetical protein
VPVLAPPPPNKLEVVAYGFGSSFFSELAPMLPNPPNACFCGAVVEDPANPCPNNPAPDVEAVLSSYFAPNAEGNDIDVNAGLD